VAVGAGERGIRTPDDRDAPEPPEPPEPRDPPEPPEPDDLPAASTASPIITAAESTVEGDTEIIPCAQPARRSREDAAAARGSRDGRGVMPVARAALAPQMLKTSSGCRTTGYA
jgi:hypothetical protein